MKAWVPRRIRAWASVVGFVLALCSCSEQGKVPAPVLPGVVAQIGERSITTNQWQAAVKRLGPSATAEERKRLLEELIRSELLLAHARKAGYHQKPELVARFDQFVSAEFKEEKLQPLLAAASAVSDQEIIAYYEAHSATYSSPEASRVGVLCLKLNPKASVESRADATQKANAILAEARQTDETGFARLVQQYSDDQATRYRGGDTGWISAGSKGAHWPAAVIDAAGALDAPGEFAPLVATETGLFIIRLLEKRSASRQPLAEVREGIRYLVVREKQAAAERGFYEALAAGVPINVNSSLVESISVTTNSVSSTPPPLPGG